MFLPLTLVQVFSICLDIKENKFWLFKLQKGFFKNVLKFLVLSRIVLQISETFLWLAVLVPFAPGGMEVF